ncbi:hypothetical protein C671_1637 [[Clostridium] bifermentans ATCC 19299]|uniref:DUF4097 family beta strand repeat-containing protein n=1 Tax=Paraclostridium bifermentans TaxID=1490 RepID=UPI00038D27B0|nr:DUF4097 family beta strand repeat-containing protein [Paraclostridium bifermentans]EQK45976.1 hypothetical protein C671_1637 [[Clostridium] bifermentans ATCC 19299] [Paraclostridium bifermentans ATCC 19299]MDV8108901.1 DUF4097 family beta strand repeat-containing protein [Bacillus sp. BAU-SS-2023]UOW67120.1 DUF4097 domain-containing protein [Paraclostridium bifermentans]
MNKKITIFAVILIAIGIIGTISSSIAAVPFATNYINECAKKASEKVTIYEKQIDVKQLDIDTKNINVEVKKSNSDKLKIVQVGTLNNNTLTIDNKENTFDIKQNEENRHIDMEIQGFGDAVINMLNLASNKIIVYVPNNVDIQAKTRYGDLIITDKDVLSERVTFSTEYSQITLPKEVKSLENLTISSNGDINLKASEILGIKNINISTTAGVYLQSMPDDVFIENIENFIPETFNIIATKYSPSINIESTVPIAKKLNIDNKNGMTYLDLPTDKYNIEFNLNASENIYFEDEQDNNQEPMKKFNGTIKQNEENQNKYNVDIKSQIINIRNI